MMVSWYKGVNLDREIDMHREKMLRHRAEDDHVPGEMDPQAKECQGWTGNARSCKRQRRILFWRLYIEHGLHDTMISDSSLQDSMTPYFSCFQPPSLWHFVMATRGTDIEAKPDADTLSELQSLWPHFFLSCHWSPPWSYVGALGAEKGEKVLEGTSGPAMEGLIFVSHSAPLVVCEQMWL